MENNKLVIRQYWLKIRLLTSVFLLPVALFSVLILNIQFDNRRTLNSQRLQQPRPRWPVPKLAQIPQPRIAFTNLKRLPIHGRPRLQRNKPPNFMNYTLTPSEIPITGYVVRTASCSIPDYDPYNAGMRPLIRELDPKYAACNKSLPLVSYVDGEFVRLNASLVANIGIEYCEYQQILRGNDFASTYGPVVRNFTTAVQPEADFVRVRCYGNAGRGRVYSNFHALTRHKPDVERRNRERLEKWKTAEKLESDDVLNVLMIAVDSTSRLNALRRLNGTRNFLLDTLQAVELRGYSRVGDNTYPNMMALLTGHFGEERPLGPIDLAPLLWKNFSAAGYTTLYVEDSYIHNHIFDIWVDSMNSPRGFKDIPTDYYFRTMNMAMFEDKEVLKRFDVCRFCLGPTYETEFILRWIKDFVSMNRINSSATTSALLDPFFALGFFSSLTHDNMNEAARMENYLMTFFDRLNSSDLLRRTAVVFISDHGPRFGISRGATRISWYEENLPMALIALPEQFRRRHPQMMDNLRHNANRLTTPFDVHETLRHLLTVNRPYDDEARRGAGRRGVSLFDVRLEDRTCEEAFIAPTYCECKLSQTSAVSTNDSGVRDVANRTVDFMNDKLDQYNGSCAKLRLSSVDEARKTDEKSMIDPNSRIYYTLTFRTSPGEGIFQAMVESLRGSSEIKVRGDILRINSYAKHSGCIVHIVHKKWCYCM